MHPDEPLPEPVQAVPAVRRKFPRDVMALMVLAGCLWSITALWIVLDLDRLLEPPPLSETQVWIAALSGLFIVYFILLKIAASWGVILGIPTCLLVVQLCLRDQGAGRRWLVSGAITAALFAGTPVALNRHDRQSLALIYQAQDVAALPQTAGRAIELASDRPMPSTWHLPLRCDDNCLDMLVFGRAVSVTRTFPADLDQPGSAPIHQTFVLGAAGSDCAGAVFKTYCAHLSTAPLPSDRLVIRLALVHSPPGTPAVLARRLTVEDTGQRRQTTQSTRFIFAQYPRLLNIARKNGHFFLPRRELPILMENDLDRQLYRSLIANRTLDGAFYPFR